MLDRAAVAKWLDDYVKAWETYDPQAIGALFAENATYAFSPFDANPLAGRDAIVANWLANRDAPGTYKAHYQPTAVDGNIAVAWGRSQYYEADGTTPTRIFDNIFVLHFDDEGKCTKFVEWFMQPRGLGNPNSNAVSPILSVMDIDASVTFYTGTLGFERTFVMTDANGKPNFVGVRLGGANIMIGPAEGFVEAADLPKRGTGIQLHIEVPTNMQIDDLYAKAQNAGANITQAVADREWGERVFTLNDPDGYDLMFAQNIQA